MDSNDMIREIVRCFVWAFLFVFFGVLAAGSLIAGDGWLAIGAAIMALLSRVQLSAGSKREQ